jgi:TolA-binding protein
MKFSTFLALALLASSTGCLKTRAQLRGDETPSSQSAPKGEASRPEAAEIIEEMRTEIMRLTGRLEELERAKSQAAANPAPQVEMIKKLEQRILDLEQAQLTLIEQHKKQQAETPPPDAGKLLEEGRTQHKSGKNEEAIETLTRYLKSPKAPKIEEATYLRAESQFALKRYKKAIVDYSQFPEKFTKSRFMPKALLRIGQSFDALGTPDDAKAFYQLLLDQYPKSEEAKSARSKLKAKPAASSNRSSSTP